MSERQKFAGKNTFETCKTHFHGIKTRPFNLAWQVLLIHLITNLTTKVWQTCNVISSNPLQEQLLYMQYRINNNQTPNVGHWPTYQKHTKLHPNTIKTRKHIHLLLSQIKATFGRQITTHTKRINKATYVKLASTDAHRTTLYTCWLVKEDLYRILSNKKMFSWNCYSDIYIILPSGRSSHSNSL